jgi:hypothetical protein
MKFHLSLAVFFLHLQLTALDSSIFYQKLREPTPEWITESINHDLAPFKTELSKKFLDQIFEEKGESANYYLVRIKVARNRLAIQPSKSALTLEWVRDIIIPHIYALHSLMPLPDIDFIFSGRDFISPLSPPSCYPPEMPPLPIFIMSKCKADNRC